MNHKTKWQQKPSCPNCKSTDIRRREGGFRCEYCHAKFEHATQPKPQPTKPKGVAAPRSYRQQIARDLLKNGR